MPQVPLPTSARERYFGATGTCPKTQLLPRPCSREFPLDECFFCTSPRYRLVTAARALIQSESRLHGSLTTMSFHTKSISSFGIEPWTRCSLYMASVVSSVCEEVPVRKNNAHQLPQEAPEHHGTWRPVIVRHGLVFHCQTARVQCHTKKTTHSSRWRCVCPTNLQSAAQTCGRWLSF